MKIAIVGAGFSGLLSAYLLEKKGLKVTVYEKEELIGGHCRTVLNKDTYFELGSVFSFNRKIKDLLVKLKVDYTERFTYRKFLNENYEAVEQISKEKIALLMNDLKQLKEILEKYSESLNTVNYGYVHPDLNVSLFSFLQKHNLKYICEVIAPYLSSYGFGNICEIQAYYALKIFDIETIYSFMHGEKLLFIRNGTSDLINKLSEKISDIRYSDEVKNIKPEDNRVQIESKYNNDYYDKVLITSKLPDDVIKEDFSSQKMKQITTNSYTTSAFKVDDEKLGTTYYKKNLGEIGKIQFFHTFKRDNKISIVAYAYGKLKRDLIDGIKEEILKSGENIRNFTTAKQWNIFPHVEKDKLTENFYTDLQEKQKNSNIQFIGSLISEPSLDNLYLSVKNTVKQIIKINK